MRYTTMKTIHYLGPANTFTERAAEIFESKLMVCGGVTLRQEASIHQVAASVDENNYGVMAYYNYLEGLVQECLDLIYERDLQIIAMHRLPIVLSLGSTPEGGIQEVYSHPKALAQCSDYLAKHYPDTRQIAEASTAAAAQKVNS